MISGSEFGALPVHLTLQEILRRCANLPPGSAIVCLNFTTDSQGGTYAGRAGAGRTSARSRMLPCLGKHTVMLGHGVVGRQLLSIEDLAGITADAALRLLNGAPPGSMRIPLQLAGQPIFDWRELQRWGIPESPVPAGASSATGAQPVDRTPVHGPGRGWVPVHPALLIIGLLYQRRARQRAESDSRRNLALAADASRRQTMSA